MTPKELASHIQRGTILPVYLLHGQDDFLVDTAAEAIRDRALAESDRSFNLDLFDGNETSAEQVVAAANTLPTMSARRVVVLRAAEKILDKPPLPSYLRNPSPESVLILCAGDFGARRKSKGKAAQGKSRSKAEILADLEERGAAVQFRAMKEPEAEAWAAEQARASGKTIAPQALKLLISLKGTSSRDLYQEIQKIVVGLGDRPAAGPEDLFDLIGVSREYNVYELSEKIGRRDGPQAQAILLRLLETGESPVWIVASLARHFFDLWKIKSPPAKAAGGREPAGGDSFKSGWQVEKLKEQAKNFSPGDFRICFNALLEADLALKSSGRTPDVVMTRLVYQLTGSS